MSNSHHEGGLVVLVSHIYCYRLQLQCTAQGVHVTVPDSLIQLHVLAVRGEEVPQGIINVVVWEGVLQREPLGVGEELWEGGEEVMCVCVCVCELCVCVCLCVSCVCVCVCVCARSCVSVERVERTNLADCFHEW